MKPPVVPATPAAGGPGGSPAQSNSTDDDASTGLPWIRSWRGVYLLVLGSFILWVVLLAWLSRIFP